MQNPSTHKRQPVNLTIRADVIKEARARRINTSRAAEEGILAALREAEGQRWLKENRGKIAAHNRRIDKNGPLLKPDWS